jgi:hypothetical protein
MEGRRPSNISKKEGGERKRKEKKALQGPIAKPSMLPFLLTETYKKGGVTFETTGSRAFAFFHYSW